jgi:hypothetical protein
VTGAGWRSERTEGDSEVTSRRKTLAVLTIVLTSVLLSACSGAPFGSDRTDQAFGKRLPGTWIEKSGDGTATLVLSENGTFEARDFPAVLVCNKSTGGPELEACRSDPGSGSISADGTWSVLDDEQGTLELDSDGRLFSVAYRDFDGFFAKSFSLGFYTGTTDKPEPDSVFERRARAADL